MERGRLEELFARFRDRGDVAALGEVFDATAPDLLRVARRVTRDRAEAEDVLQSTFLAAIEGAKGFDRERELRPWLVGILVRQAGLARRRRSAPVPSEAVRPKSGPDPADALVAREISESIALALEKLSPEDREVLVPLLVDGRRAVDIARELHRRPDTISMRIHRGLARLRRLLAPGIGLGWIAAMLSRRGLASVRRNILLHARPPATGVAVPAAAVLGGTILVNKLVLSAAAGALALASAWLLVHRSSVAGRSGDKLRDVGSALSGIDPAATARGNEVDGTARSAEASRSPAGAARTTKTAFEIVDPDGRPAAAAAVVIAQDGRPVQDLRTDDAGRVELGISGETVRLYVLRPRTMPFREEVALDGLAHRIELPRGHEVSGRVKVGGKPPDHPLRLSLTFDETPFRGAPERMEIARRLGCEEYDGFGLKQETDEDGAFGWLGLPEDWTGAVGVPYVYTLADAAPRSFGEQWLRLDAPASDLSVELEKLPCVRGRVVDAADGSPVPKAKIGCHVDWAGIHSSTFCGATADDSGRFEIPLDRRGLSLVEITSLSDAQFSGRVRPGQRWEQPGAEPDLGDVQLERPEGRTVAFVARDASGNPIAGALGIAGNQISRPTDELGHGVLQFVPFEIDRFQVKAHGFWARYQEIQRDLEGPVLVTLEAGNQLAVDVSGMQARSLKDLELHLVCSCPMFANAEGWVPGVHLREDLTGSCSGAQFESDDRTRGTVLCRFDDDGRFVAEDMRPGVRFTLQVVGPFESVLHEEEVAPLGPTEHRQISVRIAPSGQGLNSRVLSEDGSAIARATVGIRDQNGHGVMRTTGRDGSFCFSSLPNGAYTLSVEKRGWTPLEISLVIGDSCTMPAEIRLQLGHEVTIDVLGADEARVPAARVRARDPSTGRIWQGRQDRSGQVHLEDLPPISCKITVDVAGDVIERMHDALVPRMRIDLPTPGRVEVQWTPPPPPIPDEDNGCQIVLRPVDSTHGPLTYWIGSREHGPHLFPVVFPGDCTVTLERILRYRPDGTAEVEPIGSPARVVVESGQTSKVTL